MITFLIGLTIGLLLNWLWRKTGKLALFDSDDKWRKRAMGRLNHDDFMKIRDAVNYEYTRRFHGGIES